MYHAILLLCLKVWSVFNDYKKKSLMKMKCQLKTCPTKEGKEREVNVLLLNGTRLIN